MTRAMHARGAMALGLVLAACGGGSSEVVPRLPGDGSAHTATPREPGGSGADLWAGRKLIAAPARLTPKPLSLPPFERFTLGNGLTVIAMESHVAPTFWVQLAVKSGRQSEPRDKIGLSSFVASMLPRGARGRSAAQITSAMEQAGAELSSNASLEALLINCHAPSAGQSACLRAVADMAAAPSFPAGAMKEVREQLLGAARQNHVDPAQLASVHFQNALWSDEHVRGVPLSERTVNAIKRADLQSWHRANVTPRNAVLVVVSPRKPAAMKAALESAFGSWRGSAQAASAAPAPSAVKGIRIRLIDVPGARQAQVRVGSFGLAHKDKDFYAATVVNHILGGNGDRSRLGRAVTRLPGAAATTSFDRNLERGAFVTAGTAPPGQAVALMRLMMDQIGLMATDGPRDVEVRVAASELAGSYQARLSSHQEVASALLAAELHGLGAEYVRDFAVNIAKVDAVAARASAARWLDGKNLVVVMSGSAQEIEPQLADAGLKFDKVAGSTAVAESERAAARKEATADIDPKKEAAARALLDAALAAKGGAGKLGAVTSMSWKGKATLNLPGGQVPATVEKRYVSPDKLRLDMVIQMGGSSMSITTVLAGDKGWAQETRPDGVNAIEFPPAEVEAGKAQIWRDQDFVLLRHREKGARVAPLDDVELDGVAHHAVRVTSPDGKRTVTLYIDKKRRRLAGMNYSEQGVTAEESFGDYKMVKGIEIAHKRTTRSAQINLTTSVTNVTVNSAIDGSIFVKPAAAARPTGAPPAGGAPGKPAAPPASGAPGKPAAPPASSSPRPAAPPASGAPGKPAAPPASSSPKPAAPGPAPGKPAPGTAK
jgi:predicted Zn-dependent peptidase